MVNHEYFGNVTNRCVFHLSQMILVIYLISKRFRDFIFSRNGEIILLDGVSGVARWMCAEAVCDHSGLQNTGRVLPWRTKFH